LRYNQSLLLFLKQSQDADLQSIQR